MTLRVEMLDRVVVASERPVCYLRNVFSYASPSGASFTFSLPRNVLKAAVALSLVAYFGLSAGDALAEEREGGAPALAPPPAPPPAPPGDGANATKRIKEVEQSAKTPRIAKVIAEPLARSKAALERAHGARMSGDLVHARMLDGLALEWAETARDLVRAVAAEDAALSSGQKAREVELQVERARALLEETQARYGRANADLERTEADAAEALRRAATAEETRLDAAGTVGKKSAPKKPESSSKPGVTSPKSGGDAKKSAVPTAGKKPSVSTSERSP